MLINPTLEMDQDNTTLVCGLVMIYHDGDPYKLQFIRCSGKTHSKLVLDVKVIKIWSHT